MVTPTAIAFGLFGTVTSLSFASFTTWVSELTAVVVDTDDPFDAPDDDAPAVPPDPHPANKPVVTAMPVRIAKSCVLFFIFLPPEN